MKTGVIGLGAMGVGMAYNLAAAGLLESVWNRSLDKSTAFHHDTGISVAESPAQLAARVDLLITCVSRDSDLIEVIEQILPGSQPGLIVADTSTVSSDTARKIASQLTGYGVDFLDAPVSGGVEGARKGSLAMMVGGKKSVLERAKSSLEKIATQIVYMGPTGAGQDTKTVNQIMAAGINAAVTEALAFGEAANLPMDRVIEIISGGAAGNWFLEHRGSSLIEGQFDPGFKLELHHKDLQIGLSMASRLGLDLPLAASVAKHYQTLMDSGFGEDDISALYRLKKKSNR